MGELSVEQVFLHGPSSRSLYHRRFLPYSLHCLVVGHLISGTHGGTHGLLKFKQECIPVDGPRMAGCRENQIHHVAL